MIKYDSNGNVYSTTWEDERKIAYYFPVIHDNPKMDMRRVYPIKQKDVSAVCDILQKDDRVEAAMLFGSAANIRCNENSDLDIAIRLKDSDWSVKNEISEKIQEACNWTADIIWRDRITEKDAIYSDIVLGVRMK